MAAYDSSDLKSTLAYIKDRFGLDVFTKPGRVPALLSDLAPGLKNDRIMLERLSRLGILEDFVANTYENASVQKRIISKALTQLTQAEFIIPAIAASYISIMTDVFGWEIEVEIPKEANEEKMKFDSQRYLRESQERNYSLAVKAYTSENLQEVTIVSQEEGDGYIRIEWKPVKNATVEVWKCENKLPSACGDGVKVNITHNYIYDENVQNDKEYGYRLSVKYIIDGKCMTTEGVTLLMIPSSMPEPVEDLTVSNIGEDIFEANWTCQEREKVTLFCTDKRTSLQFGDTVDLKKVTSELNPLDTVSMSRDKCQFRIKDDKKYCIIPVTIKHNTAVIGGQAMAAKVEKIKITNIEFLNSELEIKLEWPKDAASILVLYGQVNFAKNIGDRKGKMVKSFSEKLYRARGALYLPNIEKKTYYITLYTACKINGELMYSEGTNIKYSNEKKSYIQYAIRLKGFLSKRQVELEFSAEEHEFFLPDIDIIAKKNAPPVFADSGMLVEHIEQRSVKGSYTISFALNSLPKGCYVKAFFTNADMNDEIHLRPAVGTVFKVN